MQIVITAQGIAIVEPEILTSLAVVTSLSAHQLEAQLTRSGFGRLGSTTHAWIHIKALRDQAQKSRAQRVNSEDVTKWNEEFVAMIKYATQKGWVNNSHVRAHIEKPTELEVPASVRVRGNISAQRSRIVDGCDDQK